MSRRHRTWPHLLAALGLTIATTLFLTVPAAAQNLNLDFGDSSSTTGRVVQFIALLTVLSLAPSIIVMVTV